MLEKVGKVGAALAALAAVAVGSAAISGAASNDNAASSTAGTAQTAQGYAPGGGPQGYAPVAQQGYGPDGRHGHGPGGPPGSGARGQHRPEKPLTGATAAKVKRAALAKVKGGTIVRVETDCDHGSPYEAHVRKPDGTEVEVLVDKQFKVTAVNACGQR